MADTFKFYCERADEAAAAAKNATLANVRERELRAEKTWRGLAMKAQTVAIQREKVERERVARRNSEIERERRETTGAWMRPE